MKKKILALCVVVSLAAVAIIGGTLAYFTDTDAETNVFTTGNVKIDLIEKFDPDNAKLMPGIDIQKEVYVKNTGSETAYVRVHIAFPAILDNGTPELAAYKNTLHWNFTKDSVQEGAWSQLQNAKQVGPNSNYPNWPGNGGTYNTYETISDGKDIYREPYLRENTQPIEKEISEFMQFLDERNLVRVYTENWKTKY